MKQKKFKFSLGLKIASILSCLALVSMGFASWWIININNNDGAKTGSFTVYDVTEKNVTVTVDSWTTPDIVYGASTKDDPVTTATWLVKNDEEMADESLVATLTFTVSSDTNLNELIQPVSVTFVPNEATKTAFDNAITAGYIAAPIVTASYKVNNEGEPVDIYSDPEGQVKEFTYDKEADGGLTIALPDAAMANKSVTVTMTFTFDWGSMTGGENPYDYFNTKSATAAYEDADIYNGSNKNAALAMLGAVDALGADGFGYNVTVNAAVKQQTN